MHLRFDYNAAADHGELRYAYVVMHELGITYRRFVPQSVAEQVWFIDCENVPDPLPRWLTVLSDEHAEPWLASPNDKSPR